MGFGVVTLGIRPEIAYVIILMMDMLNQQRLRLGQTSLLIKNKLAIHAKVLLLVLLVLAAAGTGAFIVANMKAHNLLKQAVALDLSGDYINADNRLLAAKKHYSLPSTKKSINSELARNKKWQTAEANQKRAESLLLQGQFTDAVALLKAIPQDYPKYPSAATQLQAIASDSRALSTPATESAELPVVPTPSSLIISNDYCQVDATKAPALIGVAINIANICERTYPEIEAALMVSPNLPPHRIYIVGTGYVAYEESGNVYISAGYLKKQSKDIGVVVHELAHVVQAYPNGPSWITESMADYMRLELGYGTAWSYFHCDSQSRYDSGYNCGAAFLNYVTKSYNQNLIKELDAKMRAGKYTDSFFAEKTGKQIGQLYSDCLQSDCKGGKPFIRQ